MLLSLLYREPAPESNQYMAFAILKVNKTANEQYQRTHGGGLASATAVQLTPMYASAPPVVAVEIIKREY